ncbi:metallophosphoesterase family protein [Primorskyibacter marinus]|uniref:metallophosphoesterase family protein n=1 Tax=Primorskyibacter marinus TaxID=1977320 RepID=UPI000E305083|nr:metallophosphoesterase [Primorskyibacter marinus]
MTRIVHISDLHFGKDRPELLDPLVRFINGSGAALVLLSGDLTQRARHNQFKDARAFIDRLSPQVLSVPGNHDTPLDNLLVRFLWPWSRFRKHIARDLEPCWQSDDVLVNGINTADSRAWQRGKLRRTSLRRVCNHLLCGPDGRRDDRLGIVMMHHPPEHQPDTHKRPMRNADVGLRELNSCGADIVLCGHLHTWSTRILRDAEGILLLQAGTGLSSRVRGEPNDLNLLEIDGKRLTVERHAADIDAQDFSRISRQTYEKIDGTWELCR